MNSGILYEMAATAYRAALRAEDLAADAAYGVCREAARLTAAARRRRQAAAVEDQVDGRLMELGELLYGTHSGSPADSDLLEEKLREVDELKARLADINGTRDPCPVCGGRVLPGDRYCRECGRKL